MKLQRKISQWQNCNPETMARDMSPAAIRFALEDARADILTMAKLLTKIAYPRRGTLEEEITLQDVADVVQKAITLEEAIEL